MHSWYVAQLKPNGLDLAKRNLMRQQFAVFAPVVAATVRRFGKLRRCQRPLFPGYLFVGFDPADPKWRAINSTLGVARLVPAQHGGPARVPNDLIAGLQERCDLYGLLQEQSTLAPGDRVRLIDGPFADYVGTVENIAPHQRVWILLDLLGRTTRVAVRGEQVAQTG